MIDHELDQRLRTTFRTDVGDEVAPASLYASLSEITQASQPAEMRRRLTWLLLAAALLLAATAAAVGSGLIRWPQPPLINQLPVPPVVPSPRPTLALATDGQLRFGSPLVFTTSAGEGGEAVYVMEGAGADPRTLFDGTASAIQVSPDGQYVLFEGAGPGLTLSRMDGSSSHTFSEGAWTASWALDSHALAMVTGQGDQRTLTVADVDGGEPRQIDVPARVDPLLAWSPDNVHLAYTGFEPGAALPECQAIASTLVVDSISDQVSAFGPVHPATSVAWSHDGRHLAAADTPQGVDPTSCTVISDEPLALVSVDTGTGEVSTLMTADHFNGIAWAADNRSILALVAQYSGGLEVTRVPAEGGAVETVAHLDPNWPVSSFFERGAVWSPDGSRLAWTELDDDDTETYSLWVMDLADGHPRRIAKDVLGYVHSVVQPLWSSDGAWIAFYREPTDPGSAPGGPFSTRVGGEGSIWIVRPDGSDEQLLVRDSLGVDVGRGDW